MLPCTHELFGPAGHPFDLTKTRLQTAQAGAYTGALDVVRKALARDGVTGYVPLLMIDMIFLNSSGTGFTEV